MSPPASASVVIIGGGPAGLMAAEVIASSGIPVALYDAMPSVGRKFLLAGVGGMNITHAEPHENFLGRYTNADVLETYLKAFDSKDVCEWIHGLGIETFVGTSGRVFPKDMKAAPLLRAWLHRLRSLGVSFHARHRWMGWTANGELLFNTLENNSVREKIVPASATLLALGGASWPRLGSNGDWVPRLLDRNIVVNPLVPSNCGFDIHWSQNFCEQFAGTPLQSVTLGCTDILGQYHHVRSEAIVANYGIEGTGVYALSRFLREMIGINGSAMLYVDLVPDYSMEKVEALLAAPRGKNSISNFLRKRLHLSPIKQALLRESLSKEDYLEPSRIAASIKKLPLELTSARPIAEAISSAGGVTFSELTRDLMLHKLPGVFCAGEMLDWDAPTGGYLLTACFATGRAAGVGIVNYLKQAR